MKERLRVIYRRMDHLERAYRREDIALWTAEYETQQAKDLDYHRTTAKTAAEAAREKHASDIETKGRLIRVLPDYRELRTTLEGRRHEEFQQKREESKARIIKEKAKLKARIKAERQAEADRIWQKEQDDAAEEERLRIEGEGTWEILSYACLCSCSHTFAYGALTEEEQRAAERAEEEAKKAAAAAERRAKLVEERRRLDEIAQKQRDREAEIEERRKREAAGSSSGALRGPPPSTSQTSSGPPRLALKGASGGGGGWRAREEARAAQAAGAAGTETSISSQVSPAGSGNNTPVSADAPAANKFIPSVLRGERGEGGQRLNPFGAARPVDRPLTPTSGTSPADANSRPSATAGAAPSTGAWKPKFRQ